MLGFYETFPENVHRIELFTSTLPSKKLQQKLINVMGEVNRKTFSFEEIADPTVPECAIIFELGIADTKSFSFIDEEETRKALNALKKEPFQVLDFFCAIRYYKAKSEKKSPLKFDYYMIRFAFSKSTTMEMRVFHERGPRYISPEDITNFLVSQVNKGSTKKNLKPVKTD
jgi:hypothetical protein